MYKQKYTFKIYNPFVNVNILQMITNETKSESQNSSLLSQLSQACMKLNSCLPQSEQLQITVSVESITNGIDKIVQKIINAVKGYEKILQNLEQNLRKHIKNQIELKLYYEHLEDVIAGLKKQKQHNVQTINNLKTQITVLKEREKYYMTISNNNTKNNEDYTNMESKIDTITKIKNRLSLHGTQQFYANYLTKKVDKQQQTKELRDKRQSLANTLKQLYESPIAQKKSKCKRKDKSGQKQKQKLGKSRDRISSQSKSRRSLDRVRNTKSPSNTSQNVHKNIIKPSEKQKINKNNKKQKIEEKDYFKKQTSHRRISKP